MKHADAIIVGGGIQGVSMAFAAARRGIKPILVERQQLAAGASGSSYGIVHGGLRYLQTLDIGRWRRSRQAQAWYLKEFPQYVRPLRCVMPLYKGRLRSPLAFRVAMAMEKTLTAAWNASVPLPQPHLLSAKDAASEFDIPLADLTGAACWHDAQVTDMNGLLRAMLQRTGMDTASLYIPYQAESLVVEGKRVQGLQIRRKDSDERAILTANVVINCAGAWSDSWQDAAACPPAKALAFNLLLEGDLPGNSALAVSATPGKGRSYFLRPHPEGIFAGTYYRPAPDSKEPEVTAADIQAFIDELNQALPSLKLRPSSVKAVLAGLLPDKNGSGETLSSKEHILTHQPEGFYSIINGKFTTSPLLSMEAAALIWPSHRVQRDMQPELAKQHG